MFLRKVFLAALILIFASGIAYGQVSPQALSLKQGFNFISFTVKPSQSASDMKTQNSFIEDIFSYSASAGSFLSVTEGTLTTLNAGRGYIIKASAASNLSAAGASPGVIGNITLKAGFNLAGFSKAPEPVKFTELMTRYPAVRGIYKWSPSSGAFIQVVRNASQTPEALDGIDPQITAAQSYFMNIDADTTLNYDGASIVVGTGVVVPPVKTLSSISLSKAADTMNAAAVYDLSTIAVTVLYSDNTTAAITSAVWALTSGGGSLAANKYTAPSASANAVLTASYTEAGVTKTADLAITVNAPAPVENLTMDSFEKAVWDAINNERVNNRKLAVYIEDGKITKAARNFSSDFSRTKTVPAKKISEYIRETGVSDPGYATYIYFTNYSDAQAMAASVIKQMTSAISSSDYNTLAIGNYGASPNKVTTVIFMTRELSLSSINLAENGNKLDITIAGKLILNGIGFALEGKWLKDTTNAEGNKIYDQSYYTAGTVFTAITSILKDSVIHKILFSRDTDNDPTNDTYSGHRDSNYFFVDTSKPLSEMLSFAADDTSFTSASDAAVEQEIFQRINSDRQALGLKALVWDEKIAAAARSHSEVMKTTKTMGHFEGSDPNGARFDANHRIRQYELSDFGAGENVSTGNNAFTVHEGLMSSPGHYDNLVKPEYTHAGIGVTRGTTASGSPALYVTENFVARKVDITSVTIAPAGSSYNVTVTGVNLTAESIRIGKRVGSTNSMSPLLPPGNFSYTVSGLNNGYFFTAVDIKNTATGSYTYFYGNYVYINNGAADYTVAFQ